MGVTSSGQSDSTPNQFTLPASLNMDPSNISRQFTMGSNICNTMGETQSQGTHFVSGTMRTIQSPSSQSLSNQSPNANVYNIKNQSKHSVTICNQSHITH